MKFSHGATVPLCYTAMKQNVTTDGLLMVMDKVGKFSKPTEDSDFCAQCIGIAKIRKFSTITVALRIPLILVGASYQRNGQEISESALWYLSQMMTQPQ